VDIEWLIKIMLFLNIIMWF